MRESDAIRKSLGGVEGGVHYKVGLTSAVVGIAILRALVVEVVRALVEREVKPPVWLAANVPGGDEVLAWYLKEYRHRIRHP